MYYRITGTISKQFETVSMQQS